MIKIEHDTSTGKITEIELTAAEIKEIETNAAKAQSDEATKVAEKTAVLAKLGLTAEEVASLLS
jgi:hypothetical protein